MALSTPSESPAVVVREIDLTGGVPNVQSTTGAIVGNFRWGPLSQRVLVSNEAELAATFGTPSSTEAVDFITASQFLKYSSALQVVRKSHELDSAHQKYLGTLDAATNAYCARVSLSDVLVSPFTGDSAYHIQIDNAEDFRNVESTLSATVTNASGDSDVGNWGIGVPDSKFMFSAKYPGELGNSLKVSVCPAQDPNGANGDSGWDNWTYNSSFDQPPRTSSWASRKGASFDLMQVAVIDEDGLITGTQGTVLETFEDVSILSDAKTDEGVSIYAKDVINNQSQYIWMHNFLSNQDDQGAGNATVLNEDYSVADSYSGPVTYSLVNGTNSAAFTETQFLSGFDLFEDKDQVEIDFLIVPGMTTRSAQTTVTNDAVAVATGRKDCVAVSSVARNDLLATSSDATRVTNITTTAATFTRSSYLVVDGNYLKVYDKYNDKYIYVPSAASVAGLMAATDYNLAPWYSPAGSRRGNLLGVTSLVYSPTKGQRDTLYKAGVNPIANIPGQGVLLFGDKTFLGRVSAFDRINVRRLFLVLERAIGRAAEQVLFEFNDEFTRAEFVNIVEPVLREVQGRRGITDFRVVCDETNNTPAVIDRNEFIASIFIKPARSINFVTINFVAVRTGVDFEEVVGTV